MVVFSGFNLHAYFDGREEDEGGSGENNLGLATVDSDRAAAAAQRGDSRGYSDNDSTENSNSTGGSGSSSPTPLTHETDFSKKITFAQQDVHDLKTERRELQAEVERKFEVSFEDKKNIGIKVREISKKWNRERIAYNLSEGEAQGGIDDKPADQLHELFTLMDSISEEAEQILLLLFPEKRVRDLVMETTKKESSDGSSSSSCRSIESSDVVQSGKSDSSTRKEREPSLPSHLPYFEFFQTKGEIICLQREIEKKEHSYGECISRLDAEKKERDLAVKDFRKKYRFQLCKSSSPIIEDYQLRIEKVKHSLTQQERELDEMREAMVIHYGNVSYFAGEIRKQASREFEFSNSSLDERSPRKNLSMFSHEELRHMREHFLKKDHRLSAADREKIGWDELLPEK